MNCKIIKRLTACCLIVFLVSAIKLQATVVAKSKETTTEYQTFSVPINNKAYHRTTGTIYVTLRDEAETSEWKIAKAIRPIGKEKPIFTNITPSNQSDNIDLFTLATELCDSTPYLAFVEFSNSTTGNQQYVNISKNDGTDKQTSNTLKDANGSDITDIVDIAANKSFIFAAVAPNSDERFGEPNSGIAVVCINSETLELNQTAAEGGSIIKARKLDYETDQVKIQNDVNFTVATGELFWDHSLDRLYIGLQLSTGSDAGDGAKAVVVASVNSNDTLTLHNIAPDSAFSTNEKNVVGVISDGEEKFISIKHIRVMHCSTGPSYLIVNGGNENPDESNSTIYALPLVDTNSEDPNNGTLANKNSALQNYTFVQPALSNDQLPENNDPATQVGMGPLPIEVSGEIEISDMVVLGDTVYVSINTTPDENNDSGVFYSEALFDETGKIVRWTPWTKRALPYDAFPNTCNSQGRIAFFDVDALTGKLWAVEGTQMKAVCSTAWDLGTSCESLPTLLNQIFGKSNSCKGCFSVLDLDQSTRNFTNEFDIMKTTTNRYALFGGTGKVVFARISESYSKELKSSQRVIEDFSSTENLLETRLETDSGCVNVLEFSRVPTNDTTGYFFAGTDQGLFVFADNNKSGFDVADMKELNQPPFSTGIWHYIEQLMGTVIDIKTIGNRLYIITSETSEEQPIKSKLYGIDYKNNLDAMFATTNINLLAESEIDAFNTALLFTGLEVIATGTDNPLTKEQIILATSNGLFRSCADQVIGDGMITATYQDAAHWQRVPENNTRAYWGITSPDAPIPSTVWPITIDDKSGLQAFEYSNIQQLSITNTLCCNPATENCTFIPFNFNSISNATNFQMIDPISHFWSDGTRRFFVVKRPQDPYCITRLLCLPYNTCEWCIINTGRSIIIDPVPWNTKRFYWVHQIGASGILMAGTHCGVIALE